ncbi:MAG: hypothetical protein M3376_12005 [Actinomycetota bacterium]|nr:hypothetical protein [Actinomycetota bacterium]
MAVSEHLQIQLITFNRAGQVEPAVLAARLGAQLRRDRLAAPAQGGDL